MYQNMAGLSICSYNSHGSGVGRFEFITKLFDNHDIVLVQEHWLRESELHKFHDNINLINVCGSSGMDDNILLSGRPYGGTAILWRRSLNYAILPLEITSKRICGIRLSREGELDMLLFCVYMPCDTEYDVSNLNEYNAILQEIIDLGVLLDVNKIIIAGDFNTEFTRARSLHTTALTAFMDMQNFTRAKYQGSGTIDQYTYESKITGEQYTIDHILVTENLSSLIFRLFIMATICLTIILYLFVLS
jgi:exonuclease III